jgi:hypothetical protein
MDDLPLGVDAGTLQHGDETIEAFAEDGWDLERRVALVARR